MAESGPPEKLMTVTEVARYLGFSRDTVYGLIDAGQLAATSHPGNGRRHRYRVHPDAIDAYLHTRKHAPDGGDQPGRATTGEAQ